MEAKKGVRVRFPRQPAQNVGAWQGSEEHLGQPPILQMRRPRHREEEVASEWHSWGVYPAPFLQGRALQDESAPSPAGSLCLKPPSLDDHVISGIFHDPDQPFSGPVLSLLTLLT